MIIVYNRYGKRGWNGVAWAMVGAFMHHQAAMRYTPKLHFLRLPTPQLLYLMEGEASDAIQPRLSSQKYKL
jgi:hypothetical protein